METDPCLIRACVCNENTPARVIVQCAPELVGSRAHVGTHILYFTKLTATLFAMCAMPVIRDPLDSIISRVWSSGTMYSGGASEQESGGKYNCKSRFDDYYNVIQCIECACTTTSGSLLVRAS